MIIALIVLTLLMGFAWAIGGEHLFGKWKRGVLVSLVSVGIGLVVGVPWWGLLAVAGMFYLYQALFYDMAIQMVWTPQSPWYTKLAGWFLLFVNGLMCGLLPLVLWVSQGLWLKGVIAAVISGIGFMFICWLSNGLKWGWNGCYRINVGTGQISYWCPKDTWWWACWLYGIILGVVSWMV